jgi:hypothetical protein
MEVLQYVLALQPAGLDDGQDSFHEAAAGRTPTAKTPFPPQDCPTQQPFHEVIGRFHTLDARERPQRRLQRQHVLTEGRGLRVLAEVRTFHQQPLHAVCQWFDAGLQLCPRDLAFSKRMPRGKHFFDQTPPAAAHKSARAAAINDFL